MIDPQPNGRMSIQGGAGLLLTAALLALCGCGSDQPTAPDNQPSPPLARAAWTNSLGMPFLPVPGADVQMAIWETRVRDFAAFVDATGHDATAGFYYHENNAWRSDHRSWRDPGFEQTDHHPVTGVNWRDAVAFCLWLTETERRAGIITPRQAYRLPTDREWTLAAGMDPAPIPQRFGNYHTMLALENFDHTSPVGSFPPTENGFHDMAGNVWEFCLDRYVSRDLLYIIRGGCWQNWHARFIGTQASGRCSPDIRITLYGFRVVLARSDDRIGLMQQRATMPTPPPPPLDYSEPAEEPIP